MKKIIIAILALGMVFNLSGCNYQMVDTIYNYKYVVIGLQNGKVVEGKVESWRDYKDGDQIQVTIDDTTYLVHSSNITLMTKEKNND